MELGPDIAAEFVTAGAIVRASCTRLSGRGLIVPSIPNQYHVQGGGISVSYYPDGFGPPVEDSGRLLLVYQDAHRSQSFLSDQVRTVKVDDLGMVVSVTLVESVETRGT